MYAALWRALPGGRGLKAFQCVVLALAAVLVLFVWVFPAVAPHVPIDDVTVDTSQSATAYPTDPMAPSPTSTSSASRSAPSTPPPGSKASPGRSATPPLASPKRS